MFNFGNMFNKIQSGMCRMGLNGIAINVNGQYKTYNVDTGVLTNCDNFVFDIGDDMFFAIPCNKVSRGDIILASNGPACVIESKKNEIRAFDYKTGTIVSLVPERHIIFGSTYFYSKIVSPFSGMFKSKNPLKNIAPIMMISSMSNNGSDMSKTLGMAMLMNGGIDFSGMFDGMFEDPDEDEISDDSTGVNE